MRGLLVIVFLLCTPSYLSGQEKIEFSGYTWNATAPDVKVEQYLGREALRLRTGEVLLDDFQFQNGTVEYDVAVSGHRSFTGVIFRVQDTGRVGYEHFYLRPHQTGRFDALQYTPSFYGIAAWQLYPEFNAPVNIPRDEWIHVKLVIAGSRMEAFVGDMNTPTLVVERLRGNRGAGMFGLQSNFPEAIPDFYPTAFSNFSVQVDDRPGAWTEEPEPQEGFISKWTLSPVVPAVSGVVEVLDETLLSKDGLRTVNTDSRGRVNIAEHGGFPTGASQGMVLARVVIHSDRAQVKRLNFGFSDRASVFLNGQLLFTGNNTYRSRSGRYLGVMTVDNDALYLDLRQGENELVFAVTEAFGGWGLVARLSDLEGVEVR